MLRFSAVTAWDGWRGATTALGDTTPFVTSLRASVPLTGLEG